jgi:hypothetical protein
MQCANPLCRTESLYFRSGSLHAIERNERDTEEGRQHVIWLCGECSLLFVVETWRPPGQQLQAREISPRNWRRIQAA